MAYLDEGVGLAGVWAHEAVAHWAAVPRPAVLAQRRLALHARAQHRHNAHVRRLCYKLQKWLCSSVVEAAPFAVLDGQEEAEHMPCLDA
jgi:hypothetical protein